MTNFPRKHLYASTWNRGLPTEFAAYHAVALILFLFQLACCAPASAQASATRAAVPADRLDRPWWAQRHQQILDTISRNPDAQLVMIGDSITNNYDKAQPPDQNFQPTWDTFYKPRHALNLGFSGDTTANVLWRLEHGEISGIHPKVAVVLIGTNNTGVDHETVPETEVGIDAVVAELERKLPQTHILLLGILPSDLSPEKTATDQAVNRYLARCYGEDPIVTYLDIGSIFFRNGTLDTSLFYDPRLPQHRGALHPDTQAQEMMAEAIEPTLSSLMGDEPRKPLADMTDINTAVIPAPRLEQDSYDWFARHHAELALQRELDPQVVLIGDSITHFWAGQPYTARASGSMAWQKLFGLMRVLNMGFGWDRTQNVLWRLRQGEFTGIHPEWMILNIGTNNFSATQHARANTPAEVVDGIADICSVIRKRSPATHIIVMSIFPRGADASSAFRQPIRETNRLLSARFQNDPAISVLNIGPDFLAPDGTLPRSLMPDGVHPNEEGYAIWAKALRQLGIGR